MATNIPLYETVEELLIVERWIDEHMDDIIANGGALTPELEELLNLAQLNFTTKVQRVGLKVLDLQADAKKIEVEIARLTQKQLHYVNAAKSLKAYLQRQLEEAGETFVKSPLINVRVQNSPPALSGEIDAQLLERVASTAGVWPEEYANCIEIVPEHYKLDRSALLKVAKQDGAPPLPQPLSITQGKHLRIS